MRVTIVVLLSLFILLISGCSDSIDINSNNNSDSVVEKLYDDSVLVFNVSDIPVGTSFNFIYKGQDAIVIHSTEHIHAYYESCSIHRGRDVVFNGKESLECPHGSFDLDGEGKTGLPAQAHSSLEQIPIEIIDGKIIIKK